MFEYDIPSENNNIINFSVTVAVFVKFKKFKTIKFKIIKNYLESGVLVTLSVQRSCYMVPGFGSRSSQSNSTPRG